MLGVGEGAPSAGLCSFRKVSLPSWGRTSCRAAPPALDFEESTVGWDRQAGSSGPPHVVAAPWELDEMRSRSRWPGQTSLRCHTGSHILRTERSLPKWGDPSWGPGRWTAPSGVLPPGWMAPQHSVEPPCPPGVFQQHVLLTLSPMCLLDPSSKSWLILAPQLALVCPLSPPECPIKGPLLVSLPGVIKF